MTAFWAVCEHLPKSIPLALSRALGLKEVAFDALAWNGLDGPAQRVKVAEFGMVWTVHVGLVAAVALPATMVLRRFYASMLSDEDLAIVPFYRGRKEGQQGVNKYEERSKLRKPGLTVSEAWATITWRQYLRVLAVYGGWIVVSQGVQLGYWCANTKLPCSPVGVVVPVIFSNITIGRVAGFKSEM